MSVKLLIEPIIYEFVDSPQDFTKPYQLNKGEHIAQAFNALSLASYAEIESDVGVYYSAGTLPHPNWRVEESVGTALLTAVSVGESYNNLKIGGTKTISVDKPSGGTDSTRASAVYTKNTTLLNTRKLTLNGRVYRFRTGAFNHEDEIFSAGLLAVLRLNIIGAVNYVEEMEGTSFSAGTAKHETIEAVSTGTNGVIFRAIVPGVAGNNLTVDSDIVGATFSFRGPGNTLTQGQDPAKANAILFFSAIPTDGSQISVSDIDGLNIKTYTFKNNISQPFDVKIGNSISAVIDNLFNAFNATGNPGIQYGTGTTALDDAEAVSFDANSITLNSKIESDDANYIAVTSSDISKMYWNDNQASGFFSGGSSGTKAFCVLNLSSPTPKESGVVVGDEIWRFDDDTTVANCVSASNNDAESLARLAAAMSTGASAGNYVSPITSPSRVVTATATETTLTVIAKEMGTAGNGISTSSAGASLTCNVTATAGGLDDGIASTARLYVNVDTGDKPSIIPAAPNCAVAPLVLKS